VILIIPFEIFAKVFLISDTTEKFHFISTPMVNLNEEKEVFNIVKSEIQRLLVI
jgi:hypothetical protein